MPGKGELHFSYGDVLRQTGFRQCSVEIFDAVMTYRNNHQAGVAFLFQTEFFIEDCCVKTFDGHRVQTQRRNAQQEVTDIEVNLFCHPLSIIMQIFTVHIGEEFAAFIVRGFRFRRGKAAIGIFWSTTCFSQGIVHRGFRAEHHDVRGIKHFALVEHVIIGGGFGNTRFAFFRAGNNKMPRLGVGAGWAVLQKSFDLLGLFRGKFLLASNALVE